MDPRVSSEVSITDLFDQFVEASTMRNVLSIYHRILNYSDLNPCEFNIFFPKLKRAVMSNRLRKNWKAKALFSKIDKKAAHRCYSNTKAPTPLGIRSSDNHTSLNNSQEYLDDSISQANRVYYNNNALQHYNCLVIGSGPAGLRTAIELQLLGASRVVVVEKRSRFSRNNVLHLWPFVIDDLKSLGAKKFYGKFCAGSIDHISIRQLQLILLKISLMVGCDFRDSCSYLYLCPDSIKQTRQIVKQNGNNSDSNKANGSSDSTKSITSKCDLNTQEPCISNNYIKVSDNLNAEEETSDKSRQDGSDKSEVSGEEQKSLSLPSNNELDDAVSSQALEASESTEDKDEGERKMSISPQDLDKTLTVSTTCDKNGETRVPEIVHDKTGQIKRGENLRGTRAHFQSDYPLQEKELHNHEWDIIIGADGRRNTLSKFFPRKEFRGRLAIAITANFINRQTPAEASVSEISGLSFIYNQDMFNSLAYDTNIELENICYYKDDTHYFVMTAKKKSLLERGVLINDYAATQDLLSDNNVDKQALLKYAKDAAYWTTGLEPLDFALNHYGQEDCAMFDFTSMYAASNACKALRTEEGGLTLVSLVGDSLLEPFWPTGSGCARGFLSSFDAAWMCRQWAVNKCAIIDYHSGISSRTSRNKSPNASLNNRTITSMDQPTTYNRMALSVMAERESIYRILAQTTSENLQQNYSHWTLNPHTRYPNLNRHLVMPSQVEHLITDNDGKSSAPSTTTASKNKLHVPGNERHRRVKSPLNNGAGQSRKSPKKLKSTNTSPMAQLNHHSNRGIRSKSLMKPIGKSKSHHDRDFDDTFLEFEQSYDNLTDCNKPGAANNYLSHRGRPNCDLYDDFFVPSISGTLPSSNNLLSLEARRARDIDECLRQRRQKTQLNVVRDQLIGQLRGGSVGRDSNLSGSNTVAGNAALFNELRRLREQQAKGKGDNRAKDVNGSTLTLLNSMRRCASFAERVKSFESKLGSQSSTTSTTPATTPKIPMDNVRNLPHFATLQELFVSNSTLNKDSAEPKKSKIPIMKLSKDDWNVKCWEKRLAAHKQKQQQLSRDYVGGSTKSLNKALSVDSYHQPPERQVEVFKDRIKEMADKLKKTRDRSDTKQQQSSFHRNRPELTSSSNRSDNNNKENNGDIDNGNGNSYLKSNARSQGWVSHLRRELIKGAEAKRPQNVVRQAMNPVLPNKPIKKLFDDDDEDDDGIDINKHYDHLCVNRPTNKYLSRNGGYTSHLTRSKYNSATSRVINRASPTAQSKQAYMANLTSRGSSASSNLSDYSTNTNGSSSGSGSKQQQAAEAVVVVDKCFRCKSNINSAVDKITIGEATLHRNCLTCSGCGITLRTNEIQHYLNLMKKPDYGTQQQDFVCAICKPNIRSDLTREAADRLAQEEIKWNPKEGGTDFVQSRLRSREEFLNERINYNELYKNIVNGNKQVTKAEKESSDVVKSAEDSIKKDGSVEVENADASSRQDTLCPADDHDRKAMSTSPVTVTLPLDLIVTHKQPLSGPNDKGANSMDRRDSGYRIAKSEINRDGDEQVTIILPASFDVQQVASGSGDSLKPTMIDEDELERIHNQRRDSVKGRSADKSTESSTFKQQTLNGDDDTSASQNINPNVNSSDSQSSSDVEDDIDGRRDDDDDVELSEDPSSLNSPPDTEDYDDEDSDDHIEQNSTYEDFLTSEEFGSASDRDEPNQADDEVASLAESIEGNDASAASQPKLKVFDS